MIPGRTKNFIGQDGMFFFFGIVENRLDPEGAGRVQVRCFGIHTDDKALIPTEDLPWSTVSSSVVDTDSPHDLVEGDMVWGFFVDGQEMQEPLVCGCIQSRPGGNKNPQRGFVDPGTNVSSRPRKPSSYTDAGGDEGTPVNYSAGNYQQNLTTYANSPKSTPSDAAKSATQVSSIPLPGGGSDSEPANPANRQFPYVKAKESESGHAFEMDDTPGAERVMLFHRKGSLIEIHPDGKVVKKAVNNSYELVLADRVDYTKGVHKESNSGQMILVSGNYDLEVTGNVNIKVIGNATQVVSGTNTIKAPNHVIEGDISHKGNLTSTGSYTVAGDVIGGGISLKGHTHTDTPGLGAGTTSPPN